MKTKKIYEPLQISIEFVELESAYAATSHISSGTTFTSRAVMLVMTILIVPTLFYLFLTG